MNEAEDEDEEMEKQKDGKENLLPSFINQPQADFLAEFLGPCRVVAYPAFRGDRRLKTLQPQPLGFVAVVEGSRRDISSMRFECGISV